MLKIQEYFIQNKNWYQDNNLQTNCCEKFLQKK